MLWRINMIKVYVKHNKNNENLFSIMPNLQTHYGFKLGSQK